MMINAVLVAIVSAIGLWLLVSPFVVWAQGRRLHRLEVKVHHLASEHGKLENRLGRESIARSEPGPAADAEPTPAPQTETPVASAADKPREQPIEQAPALPLEQAETVALPDLQADRLPMAATAPESSEREGSANPFETRLASRWMVWAGAVALAMGAVFLVRYSIEQGLLGPTGRVLSGVALGAILSFAGEWLRRRPMLRAHASLRPEYVPAAVAGAGLASLFASVWAGHALYDLIGPFAAFALMAAVAGATIVLALLHGPAFALFGALAGFMVPALVNGADASPWTFFAYLGLLSAACLLLMRDRGWPWLGWVAMAGALTWTLLWTRTAQGYGDFPVAGLFLIVLVLLAVYTRGTDETETVPADEPGDWFTRSWQRQPFVHTALVAIGAVMLLTVAGSGFWIPMILVCAALVLVILACSLRHPSIVAGAPIAALLTLAMLVLWRAELPWNPPAASGLVPEVLESWAIASAGFAAVFAFVCFAAQRWVRTPTLWSVLSGAMPLLLTALVYATTADFQSSYAWAAIALAEAVLALLATERLLRRDRAAAGTYAVVVCTALALGAAMLLREAWLTAALALMLPALAWVHRHVPLPPLRWVARVVLGVVMVRLLCNPALLEYGEGAGDALWALYGYGVPALACLAAAFLFGGKRSDRLTLLLQGSALTLGVALQLVETQLLLAGSLTAPLGLKELCVHGLLWLGGAWVLTRAARASGHPVLQAGGTVLLTGALLGLGAGPLLLANPLFTNANVGSTVILNLLLPAYGLPAALLVLLARERERQAGDGLAGPAGAMALVLALVWVTLSIRQAFQGPYLAFSPILDAELYAYSVGWLVFGLGLLAAGLVSGRTVLRYASLAVVCTVAAKVFLWDMAGLTGVLRALAFLGLGGVLIGIGFLYQRFVFRRDSGAEGTG